MSQYLAAACALVGAEIGQVVKHREQDGSIIMLIDWGVHGTKRHIVAPDALQTIETATTQPPAEPEKSVITKRTRRTTKKAG